MYHRTVADLVARVQAGDFKVLEGLSADARQLIHEIMYEIQTKGHSITLDALWEEDFEVHPVNIDTFLEDDYFLGKIGVDIYPRWRDELSEVCDPKKEICEWVIRGCVGAGKTTVAVIALLHRIHVLCCMKNPQRFYKLMEGSPIVFGLFNIFKYLAMDTSYKYFTNWVKLSPFFQETMRKAYQDERTIPGWLQRLNRMYGIGNEELANSYMRFPKGITLALGSNAIHALGQNLYGGLLDEADMSRNRSIRFDEKTKVEELYGQAKSRLDSRFLQIGGVNPGILVLVSQVQDVESFLSKHVDKVAADPRTHISSFAIWEIKEHLFPKEEPRFKVVVGNRQIRSFIIDGSRSVPDGVTIIDVPESLRPRFEYSLDDAIRDQAGIPTFGSNLFLPRRDKLYECYKTATPREHPFSVDTIELSIESGDPVRIEHFFRKESCMHQFDKVTGAWKPRWYPGIDRAVHVDLAKNKDCAGMSMGCMGEVRRVHRFDDDGRPYAEMDYSVFIDFALRIAAVKGSEIDFSKIRAFIFYLTAIGFPIRYVSYDGYQSVDSQQFFKKAGYDVKELSVDKKAVPYHYLRSTIYEGRLDMYEYEPFTSDVTKLQDKTLEKAKPPIDHPPGGSKDVSDGVCGVITRLVEVKEEIKPVASDAALEIRARDIQGKPDPVEKIKDQEWLIRGIEPKNPLEDIFKKAQNKYK
jgi:hypothetical protein